MKKIIGIIIASMSVLSIATMPAFAQGDNQPDLTPEQSNSFEKLHNRASNLYLDWDILEVVPNFIRLSDLKINWHSDNCRERSYQFLDKYRDLYKIDPDANLREEFKIIEEEQDELGMTHITLQQKYQNIPVFAGQLKIHFRKDKTISSVSGTYLPNLSHLPAENSFGKNEAFDVALSDLPHQMEVDQDLFNKMEFTLASAEITAYNPEIFSRQKSDTNLVWHLKLRSDNAVIDWDYFINANTGDIIDNYDSTLNAMDRETYVLENCYDNTGDLIYDETGLVGDYNLDAEQVHSNASVVYNYYNDISRFNRDSYDGAGGLIKSRTHWEQFAIVCLDLVNARWSNGNMYFAQGVYGPDIVGHEFSHGVVFQISDLETSGQPRALHESYADTFGSFIDIANGDSNWIMGEDIATNRNDCSQGLRSMEDPDSYTGECEGSGNPYPDHINDLGGDYSDEYAVSNIPSHANYLLTIGGTHSESGISVTGIGQAAAEQIIYRAIDLYINPDSDLVNAFENTLTACLDLHDSDPGSYPFSYCESVFQAFKAVGINTDDSFIEVAIEANPTDGYAPLAVSFDGSGSVSVGGNITDYNWDFGDGNTDSGANVNHTYNGSGSFEVTLTITDDTGNTNSAIYEMEVFNPIQPYFTFSGDGYPAPVVVSFDASSTYDVSGTITNYSWNYGDGNIESTGTSPNASHEYTSDGYYNVTLTVTDDLGYSNTYRHSVTIGSGPTTVSGTIYNDTWTVDKSPYLISSSINITEGGTLDIEEGTVIKFQSSSNSITVYGTLSVSGTEADPVVFTSYKDDEYGGDTNNDGTTTTPAAGDWSYINFASGSAGVIDNAVIRCGGNFSNSDAMIEIYSDNVFITNSDISDTEKNVIQVDNASPNISNNTIARAGDNCFGLRLINSSGTVESNEVYDNEYGIYVYGSGSPAISQNNVHDNDNYDAGNAYGIYINNNTATVTDNILDDNEYAIYISASSLGAVVTGNTGTGNNYNGIHISGSVSDNVTLNNDNDFSYLFSQVTIDPGYTLTLVPGITVKFPHENYYLQVDGTLDAQGTELEPIVFTSLADDEYGGDTNNDGNATLPAAGDWSYINFTSGSTGTIDNARIRYGGNFSNSDAMVEIYSDTVFITNSDISDTEKNVVQVNNASPNISNSTIARAGSGFTGLKLYYSSATVESNEIYDNEYGIYLYSESPNISTNTIRDNVYGGYADGGATPTMTQNNIYDNSSYGVYASSAITAEDNWWGDATGPYNGNNNPSGLGDSVNDNVGFDPWLGTEYNTIPPDDITWRPPKPFQKRHWDRSIKLKWIPPSDPDLDHYIIERFDGTSTVTLESNYTGIEYLDINLDYLTPYQYTIYAVDDDGNQSPGVTTSVLVLIRPTPRNLTATSGDQQIELNWNAPPIPPLEIGGYNIYYGTDPANLNNVIDVGNVTNYTITGLTNGTTYFMAASAYNSFNGQEGPIGPIVVAVPTP